MRRGDCREIEYQVGPTEALAIQSSNYNRDGLAPEAKVVGSCGVVMGGVRSYDADAVIVEVVEAVGSCGAAVAVAAAPAAVLSVVAMEAGV